MRKALSNLIIANDLAAARQREEASASWTEEAISDLQLQKLKEVWRASQAIPYYQQLVKEGSVPRELSTWQDLQSIPILTRQIIQDSPEKFIRPQSPPDAFAKTAGSVGTPICLGMSKSQKRLMKAVKLSCWRQCGYEAGSRLFLIWGHSHLLGTGFKGKLNHLKRKAADYCLGYRRVNAYLLDQVNAERYAQQLCDFRPHGVIGYTSALDIFVRQNLRYVERFRSLGVRFVLATSEPPPREDTHQLLSDAFNCDVVQEYGGAEFGQIAFKRGAKPFKVFADLNYVEAVPAQNGPSDAGRVVITSLYPSYCPLVRYEVGDEVSGVHRLWHGHVTEFEKLAGRVNEAVVLSDGKAIHSVGIFHCIHQESSVLNIQMLLTDTGNTISLITTPAYDAKVEDRIRKRLGQLHPELKSAKIKQVLDLQTTRAGKRKWLIDLRQNRTLVS